MHTDLKIAVGQFLERKCVIEVFRILCIYRKCQCITEITT